MSLLKLQQVLLGLKSARRNFFEQVKAKLEKIYCKSDLDASVLISDTAIYVVYVDDALLVSSLNGLY